MRRRLNQRLKRGISTITSVKCSLVRELVLSALLSKQGLGNNNLWSAIFRLTFKTLIELT